MDEAYTEAYVKSKLKYYSYAGETLVTKILNNKVIIWGQEMGEYLYTVELTVREKSSSSSEPSMDIEEVNLVKYDKNLNTINSCRFEESEMSSIRLLVLVIARVLDVSFVKEVDNNLVFFGDNGLYLIDENLQKKSVEITDENEQEILLKYFPEIEQLAPYMEKMSGDSPTIYLSIDQSIDNKKVIRGWM